MAKNSRISTNSSTVEGTELRFEFAFRRSETKSL